MRSVLSGRVAVLLLYLYGLALEDGVERDVSQRAVPGATNRRRRAVVNIRLWRGLRLQLGSL